MFNKSLYLINLFNNMNLFPNIGVRESKERDLRKDRNIKSEMLLQLISM